MIVDVLFPAGGADLPTDHSYPLFAALSAAVPGFHAAGGPRFAPIPGDPGPPGRLRLTNRSHLRVRVDSDRVRDVLPLAGRPLDVGGSRVRLGVPTVAAVVPAAAVWCRLATFKGADTAEQFLLSARRGLEGLSVTGEPSVPLTLTGGRAGEPQRRVVRVKGLTIYGYALQVTGLSAADSLSLQASGLGGRTRIGCGFFLPMRGESE